MKKFFGSKDDFSDSPFDQQLGNVSYEEQSEESCPESTTDGLRDREVREVINDLKLKDYTKNFVEMKVIFEDLPNLKREQLEKLIPDEVPRNRLNDFIEMNFLQKENGNGWEISSNSLSDTPKKLIRTGGFGSIRIGDFKVGNSTLNVALKELVIDGKNIKKEAVIREVKLMSLCHHPNVLKCFGCFFSEDERMATICLEYLPEGDLIDFSERHKLSLLTKLEIIHEIAKGIEYLHNKGIVHRDLKLANILVTSTLGKATAKICDFGSSKMESKVGKTFCGTVEYIPPEVFVSDTIEKPTAIDIYAFGIIMWEIFCEENPYEELHQKYPDQHFKMLKEIHNVKTPLRPDTEHEELENVHMGLLDLMELCWDEDFDMRPKIREVLDELNVVIDEEREKEK